MSRFDTAVDQQLSEARVDEDDLHDHGADDEIGEIEGDHVDDRRQRVGQRVRHDDAASRACPSAGPFRCMGAASRLTIAGSRHAHHVSDDHDQVRVSAAAEAVLSIRSVKPSFRA